MRFLGLAWQDALVVGLYLVAMMAIGIWFKVRAHRGTTEEYLLGNRGMPWWLVGVAYLLLAMLSFIVLQLRRR